MSSLQLSWSIEGEQQLSRVLRGVGAGIKDWTPAFKETADELVSVFSNDVFASEGRKIGEKWDPLSPRYLAQKRADGYGGKGILERTGEMRKSFQKLFKADHAEVWNSAAYFQYHQSKAPRRSNLPRRVMMKLAENQKQLVVKIFHTYWYQKINDAL